MATASTINLDYDGGTITFSATSEPSNPTISITGGTWATVSGNKVTVSRNGEITNRTTTISVKTTTPSNNDYSGTTSITSSYTISQESEVVDSAHANVLDIVFESKKTDDVIIVKNEAWSAEKYPESDWSPIGIVVIPAEHGVLKDGTGTVNQCGIMSLLEMHPDHPESGDTIGDLIIWGGTPYGSFDAYDISGKTDGLGRYDSVTDGLKNYNGIPSSKTKNNKAEAFHETDPYYVNVPVQEYAGDGLKWGTGSPYAPTPYAGEGFQFGPYNEDYGTTSLDTSNRANAFADFKGIVNTKILTDLHTGQSNWKTANKITDSFGLNLFPAACCCARFHTKNTKAFVDCTTEELRNGTGFWYMPAYGELVYILPRKADIESTMKKLESIYKGKVIFQSNLELWYLSSSERNKSECCLLHTEYGIGNGREDKDMTSHALAFMRL